MSRERPRYGKVATDAVDRLQDPGASPSVVWDELALVAIPKKTPRGGPKRCPRGAFLGLCEQGWVKGVPPRQYLQRGNNKNKQYTIDAAKYLAANPSWATSNPDDFWKHLVDLKKVPGISHNYQLDVLLALWPLHIDHEKVRGAN